MNLEDTVRRNKSGLDRTVSGDFIHTWKLESLTSKRQRVEQGYQRPGRQVGVGDRERMGSRQSQGGVSSRDLQHRTVTKDHTIYYIFYKELQENGPTSQHKEAFDATVRERLTAPLHTHTVRGCVESCVNKIQT